MLKKYIQSFKNLPLPMRASIFFMLCSFVQKGISIITTPIFTRILSTAEYGEYSVFYSWLQILAPIICLNLYSGVYSQGIVKFEEERDKFTSTLQGLMLSLVLVWTLVYLGTKDFWNNLFGFSTHQMVAMFLMIWASGVFSFWAMSKRVDYKYQKLVTITLIVAVVQPTLSIVLISVSEDKVSARIWGVAFIQLVFYGGMFISQMFKGKKFFSKKYWKYALKFNIPLLPHYISLTILSSSDRIMIERMVGPDAAGIYNLAYSVSLIMMIFNTALLQTIEPWIYRKIKENKVMEVAKVAYPCFFIIALLNILLIMLAPEVISIFAPASYSEAIWIVPGVALSVFFTFLYTFFATFEFYFEKTKYIAGATVGGAILNIFLNYICIQKYGYIAAGYTTLFSYVLFAVLHYVFMRKICKRYLNDIKPYDLRVIVGIAIGIIVLGFGFMAIYRTPVIRYSLMVVTIIVLFFLRKKIISIMKMFIGIKKNKA